MGEKSRVRWSQLHVTPREASREAAGLGAGQQETFLSWTNDLGTGGHLYAEKGQTALMDRANGALWSGAWSLIRIIIISVQLYNCTNCFRAPGRRASVSWLSDDKEGGSDQDGRRTERQSKALLWSTNDIFVYKRETHNCLFISLSACQLKSTGRQTTELVTVCNNCLTEQISVSYCL